MSEPTRVSRTAELARAALAEIRGEAESEAERMARARKARQTQAFASGARRRRGPVSVRSLVKSLLRSGPAAGLGLWEPVALGLLRRKWRRVVGDAFAGHTWAEALESGTLRVVADDSSWAEAIERHADEILRRAARTLSTESSFAAIRARVGELPPPEAPAPPPTEVQPDPIWTAILRREAEAHVRDPALRESLVAWLARLAAAEGLHTGTATREGNP